MIDETKLDKRHTYVCLEYGTGAVSRIIQVLTEDFCMESLYVPSHVFALVYEDRVWRIYESHLKAVNELPSGVRTYTLDKLKEYFPDAYNRADVYELKFNRRRLKDLLGQKYGVGDIECLLRACVLNRNGKQKDRKGYICSEYLATAHKQIQRHFELPPHCITPAHFLKYLLDIGAEKIE